MFDPRTKVKDFDSATKSASDDASVAKHICIYGMTDMSALLNASVGHLFIASENASRTAVNKELRWVRKQVSYKKKSFKVDWVCAGK